MAYLRADRVVPLTMKRLPREVDCGELLLCYLLFDRIETFVDGGSEFEAGLRRGSPNQINHYLSVG